MGARRIFRMETPLKSGRDPVCEAIESLLHDLVVQGHGPLEVNPEGNGVRLRFGNAHADGPTYDIALVRLANEMIDDPKYCKTICDMLRGETTAPASARPAQASCSAAA